MSLFASADEAALQTAATIFKNIFTAPDAPRYRRLRVSSTRVAELLTAPNGPTVLFLFGFTRGTDEWVLPDGPLTPAAAAVGEAVIKEAAARAGKGALTLDMLNETMKATLRKFSTAWAARAPSLKIGISHGAYPSLCKFCHRAGQPNMSLNCSECNLSVCGPCRWRDHIAACARCLKVHCADCIAAHSKLAPCASCKMLICDPPCTPTEKVRPCTCADGEN